MANKKHLNAELGFGINGEKKTLPYNQILEKLTLKDTTLESES
ncbi:hypothetical protein [Thalassomonas viridans]|nr:hypothetical protein [Thalassomonas viridans]